jgi:histidyl-tRNA synthetase
MTKLTENGVSTTTMPCMEQYETFIRKVGGKTKKYFSYDFRDHDGELFSTVKPTLEQCRAARDEWVDKRK